MREINANGFASALLLPEVLLRAECGTGLSLRPAFNTAAARWGVSRTTLRIRVEKLGLASLLPR